ncbi:MAG: isoleucine--tRNA ligase [Candidatus Dojkabacteria bacterium]|nr:isoleucine--tRNA ligase [Candidatus Dojkabacteria bacterium]
MFNKPNPRQDFHELEKDILNWWKENNVLEKSIEQRPDDNIKTFYDGPITANGEPHTGHMLTFSLKDIIPRYWSMQGYKVSRSLGWDCHGIPVEYEIEKKLGFKEKKDIEKYGIKEFNQLCKESVIKYQKNIIELEEAVGRLTNGKEEYATMDSKFIESVWWSLKELFEKGHLYEGFKVVPYSTRAGTTLSNAEVALGGYKPFVDPAITVKFQLKDEESTFVLAWTTTPWTIPTNLGLAINPKIKYVKVKGDNEDETYICAKDCLEFVFKDAEYKILEEVDSSTLLGKEYNPPFDFFKGRKNSHKIFAADYVSTESGTGIVHLAPYGAEDNDVFMKEDIESFDVLDDQGDFTEEITPYAGMFYRKANKYIIKDLEEMGRLWRHEDYEHDMPMCWRTKTPLIYKPITSWYVGMSKVRTELVENNNKINWIPAHAREGRFGNWLSEIKDWAISRKRYWGTPLPVWKSESGKTKVIGSFEELEELSGVKLEDPHRPFVDEVTFELDGETYTRITDVIDVWYDSGAMPFARFHYPFENKEKFEKKFPAEYIAEGIDQTRGWFYTLHAEGTVLFNSPAFKNVIINGTITDDKGRKLSKSLGNYTPPMPLIEQHGADSIRLNFYDSPLMYGEDSAVTDKTIKANKQETILPLLEYF